MAHQLHKVETKRDEERWEIEIRAEVPAEVLATYRERALKEIQKTAKLDGFRPGHAPIERILAIYGESAVMRQAAQLAIESQLPELIAQEQAPIVEAPKVTTDTPESGKPLVFTARAPLAPSVELGDYAAIAAQHPLAPESETQATDEDHAQALQHLRRERARIEKMEAGAEAQKAHEESRALEEKDLPALDDTFVQSLGYENTEKFSEAVRANIANEKQLRAGEKRRAAILDDIVKHSKLSYPAMLREYELDEMEARFKDDLSRAGLTPEQYLAEVKKTLTEMRESWKPAADTRAKVRLVLAEIARRESIESDEGHLAHELAHAKQHYPQADPETLRAHIAHALRNEAVIHFLETGSKDFKPEHSHNHEH